VDEVLMNLPWAMRAVPVLHPQLMAKACDANISKISS
jgi:hypothetical protein